MVDTTAPSAPTGFTFSAPGGDAYYPGAGTIVCPRRAPPPAASRHRDGSTDADTGIAGYTSGAIDGHRLGDVAGAFTFTAASPSGAGTSGVR